MSENNDKRVLCYIRPWSVEQFLVIAREAFPGATLTTASDYLGLGDKWFADEFYAMLQDPAVERRAEQLLTPEEQRDIIARCRFLRSETEQSAKRLLAAMALAISKILDEVRPDYILSYSVDAYTLDLLYHLGAKRGILFIGLSTIFVNGYFRVTARGEYNRTGDAAPSVVNERLDQLLQQNYQPIYISAGLHSVSGQRGLYLRSVERWAKNLARLGYFWLKRQLGKDKHNFHYGATLAVARAWLQPFPPFFWTTDWQEQLRQHQGRRFYIPLQWTPEGSIDYWCPYIDAIDYDARVKEVVEIAERHGQVVVKEHPAFVGYRRTSFYRALQTRGALFPPANASSVALIAASEWTIVYTGSVGFEAAIRGKQVALLGNPYYRSGRFMHEINDLAELDALLSERSDAPDVTREEQFDMMKHVLDGALTGRFRDDGSYDPGNPEHIQEAAEVGEALRGYIDSGLNFEKLTVPGTGTAGRLQ